jgi:hypothetical protein
MLPYLNIRPEHGIHAREVALRSTFESVHHVCVEAQVNGGLPGRHNDAGTAPEVRAKGFSFGNIGAVWSSLRSRFVITYIHCK